uniref:Secreted protein n=1 Tax=Burkholderia sp. (strain CCGE1003) TaxID=640512 RepID=E1TIZ6_BURSG
MGFILLTTFLECVLVPCRSAGPAVAAATGATAAITPRGAWSPLSGDMARPCPRLDLVDMGCESRLCTLSYLRHPSPLHPGAVLAGFAGRP